MIDIEECFSDPGQNRHVAEVFGLKLFERESGYASSRRRLAYLTARRLTGHLTHDNSTLVASRIPHPNEDVLASMGGVAESFFTAHGPSP